MAAVVPCPAPEVLRRLVQKGGAPAEIESLAQHLEGCETCGKVLETLLAADSTVAGLRASTAELPRDQAVLDLKERLRRLQPAAVAAQARDETVQLQDQGTVSSPDRTEAGLDFLSPAQQPQELGRLGNYRVLKVLGKGGMGMVLLAEDLLLQRKVALKTMLPAIAANTDLRQRFLREARSAASIEHEHIITIHQVGEDNGVAYLAMPLLKGESLEDRLDRERQLPVPEALRIAAEMAQGLAAAHAEGLIHRDVKPGNVWLEGKQGKVKLLDFGLARLQSDDSKLTQSGMIVGTPAFMAPEQARGEPIDARADLFSLGCVLYLMLTGERPFKGENALSTLMALATHEPPAPQVVNPDVPADVSDLTMRLLAKEAARRPASAQEVVDALAVIRRGMGESSSVTAVQRSPLVRVGSRWSDRGWAATVLGLLVLAGLAALAVVIIRDKQGKEIARIEVPEGGIVEVDGSVVGPKKGAQGEEPPRDRAKPFVLVRAGRERHEFKTFGGVLNELQDGDAIEVHGNGPFLIGPVELKGRSLTVRAAPGYRPQFRPDADTVTGHPWLQLQTTSVHVEGCDFQAPLLDLGRITGGGAPWEFRGCRFLGAVMLGYKGPQLTVADSLIARTDQRPFADVGSDTKAALVNNLVLGSAFVGIADPAGGQTIRLQDNTLIGNAFAFGAPNYKQPITVEASGNLFHATHGYMLLGGFNYVKADINTWLRWQGKNNLYAEEALWWKSADGKQTFKGLADWNKYWGKQEEGSREAKGEEMHYRWEEIGRQAPDALVASLRQLTAGLRRRHGLAELGPDWDLVGPGDAYVRALAAEGRPVPKEKLRQEAPIGGPFVLVRNGKDVSGYRNIGEVISAATDGDTIEIRSDKIFQISIGGGAGGGNIHKRLTLRAAPGYHPVWRGMVELPAAWTLTLEGIAFEQDGNSRLILAGGRYVRIANCSFRWTGRTQRFGDPLLSNVRFQPEGDNAPELVNCLLPVWCSYMIWPADRKLTLRNSVIGWFNLGDPSQPDRRQLMLDRCVVWNPLPFGLGADCTFCRSYKPMSIEARHTFFQTNNLPLGGGPVPLTWSGSGNLYGAGYHSWLSGPEEARNPIVDLTGWQKHFKSDADSAEGEPLYYDSQQWRLLPDSAGHGQGPGGRDFGADVDKVTRPATSPPAPPPAEAPKVVVRDKPFVLLRQGAEVGAFQTFAALWEEHRPGDEIVVHGNGPFHLPYLRVKDRILTVKAGPGFRPVFLPDESLFDQNDFVWLRLENSGLTIEGCDLMMRGTPYRPGGRSPPELIGGGDKPCVFRGCRLLEFALLFHDFRSVVLTVEDCLILCQNMGDLPANAEVTLSNNLICCGGGLVYHFGKPGGQKLRLTRNAFAIHTLVHALDPGLAGITVTAEGNLFQVTLQMMPTKDGFKNTLRWQGKDNCYTPFWGGQGLATWFAQLHEPEVNSREVPVLPFGWLTEMPPGEVKRALPWWRTHLAQARLESGLNDLGPDMSLVGPGEAYVLGLAEEGRPVAKEQLRPEPLPGGRVVLMRGGQPLRGFHLLQDAFNAVQDNDVVEVRTDAALAGGDIPADRGALALRAGPGYRPVIQSLISFHAGTALAVEGLTFSSDAFLGYGWDKNTPPEKLGRVTRLAYCSFDRRRTGSLVLECEVSGRDGSPGEVLRCAFHGPVRLRTDKGTQVRLRECLLGAAIVRLTGEPDSANTCTLQLDGCALISLTPFARSLIDDTNFSHLKAKSRWIVRRCLLESKGVLLPGGIPPGWTGERNLYRIGLNWGGDRGIHGLVQWRGFVNSPETGSMEGLPSIADPRAWKLPPGSLPKDVGPDMDHFGGADRVGRKEEEPPPQRAGDKPFVLLRQGAEAGAFGSFAALWEVHQPGDEIVVKGDGPFRLPDLKVQGRTLVLRAAPGFRPVLLPHESVFARRVGSWIDLDQGALTVEGCDFFIRDVHPGQYPPGLVGGGDGPCVFRGCRMLGFNVLVAGFRSTGLTLEDCLLLTGNNGLGFLPAHCQLTLLNNLIHCGNRLSNLMAPGSQKVSLRGNAIVPGIGAAGGLFEAGNDVTGVSVTAEGNLIDFSASYSGLGRLFSRPSVKGDLHWQGKNNGYAGLDKGLAAWNASLPEPEAGSREVPPPPLGWRLDPPSGTAAALKWWQERLAEARRKSGLDDLGPDVALVGPGEAYLRGLAAEGRPVAKGQLRREPVPGGRLVLVRGGQDVEGFFHLKDAFASARDGDTIEVRTDAALDGATLAEERGALILRAAPGYRPALQSTIDVRPGSALAIEGMTFLPPAQLYCWWVQERPPDKQARISRLAYCSFEGRDDHNPKGISWLKVSSPNKEGPPTELFRCLVERHFNLLMTGDTHFRLRESILNSGIDCGPVEKTAAFPTVEMEACIVARNWVGVSQAVLFQGGAPVAAGSPPLRWVTRRCLFEGNENLTHFNHKVGWSGEKNYYRLGEWWGDDAWCLSQWRAAMKSAEKGSVEGEALIAEPQRWRLAPGSPADGFGPDIDRIIRRIGGHPK
jgi:hypothetical protein